MRAYSKSHYVAKPRPRHYRLREECSKGHALTDENVYICKDGQRACRICRAENRRKHHELSMEPEKRAAWLQANRERMREYRMARKARVLSLFVERVSAKIVFERDEGICGICHKPVDPFNYHIDHVIPLAAGGPHSYANCQVAHPTCNLQKGSRYPGYGSDNPEGASQAVLSAGV